jgi:hypothetical protein
MQNLDRQGRVHEIHGHNERIAAITTEYAKSPENTLVVSPDNRSRTEINERIHTARRRGGLVSNDQHSIRLLGPRQDLTGADRTWAERYQVGDVLRYETGSARVEPLLMAIVLLPIETVRKPLSCWSRPGT